MTARRWALAIGVLALLVVGGIVWLGVSAVAAVSALTAARDDLVIAKGAIDAGDVDTALTSIESAAGHAESAAGQTSSLPWRVASAIPAVGATPEAVRTIATALDQAVAPLAPAAESLIGLQLNSLVGDGGSVDAEAISTALPGLQAAEAGIAAGVATLAGAPTAADSRFVLGQVDEARAALSEQLGTLSSAVDGVTRVAEIAPPLLGLEGPRRYIVAILNPNEARGTGGFLGTYAIVTADAGRLTVDEVGSNTDLPGFATLPIDLGADFEARYGDGAGYIGNMNISPHHPNAGQLWLESWEAKTGERLDGALSADVVALGQLVTASGREVPLPGGGSLTGEELTAFALSGIYEKFPDIEDSAARQEYQEAVALAATEVVTDAGADNPVAMADALATAISERRVLAWVTDDDLQASIIETPLGGSLAVPDGPNVTFVALDSSASKLDTYLARTVRYDAGRCAADGTVRSQVSVTLTNDIPEGSELPAYVISQADVGPDGPINSVLAQVHLSNGARILDVRVDGEEAAFSPFPEQGRTSLVLDIELPPRQARTITVLFEEPYVAVDPVVGVQPLALPQETQIVPRGC